MIRITLTAEERVELRKARRKGTAEVRERASYVLLSDEGKSVKAIAAHVNRHEQTVRKWLKAYREGGVNALYNKHSLRQPKKTIEAVADESIETRRVSQELPSHDLFYRIIMEDAILPYQGDQPAILQALHETQNTHGYLSKTELQRISREFNAPSPYTHALATRDTTISLQARGKYVIRVCNGTACHLQLSEDIADELFQYLQVNPGGTTEDRLFTVEQVYCLGTCTIAPAISINRFIYGNLTRRKVRKLIDSLRRKEERKHHVKKDVIPVSLETEVPVMKRKTAASSSEKGTLRNRLVRKIHQLEHLIIRGKEEK
jgi:NADH-quinone oxidoreductase subunit E